MSELDPNRTPGPVIGAVAAGTVVVPFLIVYAFLFIVHGAFVPVDQPDITGSRRGELVAGLVALAYLLLVFWGMGRLLNGFDRWVFAAGQLLTAGAALYLLLDSSSGEPEVPAVVLAAALLALVLTFVPPSWVWVASRGGQFGPGGPTGRPGRRHGRTGAGGPAAAERSTSRPG